MRNATEAPLAQPVGRVPITVPYARSYLNGNYSKRPAGDSEAAFVTTTKSKRNVLESFLLQTRVYPKIFGLAAWSENCKWYSSLPLGAVVSLFCEPF
jgi:hypothetical protein